MAVICVRPVATAVAVPLVASCVLSIVATPVLDDAQDALRVISCGALKLPSGLMMIAMAVKAWVPGKVIVGNAGVTAMDLIPLTESTAGDDVMVPSDAVLLVIPAATVVATPVFDDPQVMLAPVVKSFDVPLL